MGNDPIIAELGLTTNQVNTLSWALECWIAPCEQSQNDRYREHVRALLASIREVWPKWTKCEDGQEEEIVLELGLRTNDVKTIRHVTKWWLGLAGENEWSPRNDDAEAIYDALRMVK